ncbi:OsmC family protein [Rhodovibrionaceae bacterium A322]
MSKVGNSSPNPNPAPTRNKEKTHHYESRLVWTGNKGEGTANYRAYDRSYNLTSPGKPVITGSSDPAFRGDPACWNPEDLLLSSVSSCHMLWFLHLASTKNLRVQRYQDHSQGVMTEDATGGGRFSSLTLQPEVTLPDPGSADERAEQTRLVETLHHDANKLCFVANSLSLPVNHQATTLFE